MVKRTQRCALEGSNIHTSGIVRAKKRHVIDGDTVYKKRVRHLAIVLVLEGQSNSRLF